MLARTLRQFEGVSRRYGADYMAAYPSNDPPHRRGSLCVRESGDFLDRQFRIVSYDLVDDPHIELQAVSYLIAHLVQTVKCRNEYGIWAEGERMSKRYLLREREALFLEIGFVVR